MPSYAYLHKQFVPLSEAKIGVMTNFIHYGTGVFEGIRGNWNSEKGEFCIFRLKEHYERLHRGCQVLNIDLPYSVDELCRITVELVEKCGFKENIYIRPLAYKSSEALGVRLHGLEDDFMVFAFPWGPYLPDKVRCAVSSWRLPRGRHAKFTGLYTTNALAKTEAVSNGFDEAIMLTTDGYVSQGSGEHIFLVIDGTLVTPPGADGILIGGITRDTAIKLAQDELGISTTERHIDRIELYFADECFLTGTAANVSPVAEIDRRTIGNGEIGEITKRLQKLYSDAIIGNNPKYSDWCTPVRIK